MEEYFGTKGLYSVVLKATYDIGDLGIKEGEVVAEFDNIQIGGLDELRKFVSARGGYGNPGLVTWETSKEVNLTFSQGIFSKEHFRVLTNAGFLKKQDGDDLTITTKEFPENEDATELELKHIPVSGFVYYKDKIKQNIFELLSAPAKITASEDKKIAFVRYEYVYEKPVDTYSIGNMLIKGYLSLEGRMRLKDDETGHTTTGILKIPKLKLMSDLSMSMGRNSVPFTSEFHAVGYPTGGRGAQRVCEFYILPEDIDGNDIMIEDYKSNP